MERIRGSYGKRLLAFWLLAFDRKKTLWSAAALGCGDCTELEEDVRTPNSQQNGGIGIKNNEKIKTHRFPANSAERLPVGLCYLPYCPKNQSSTSNSLEAAILKRLAAEWMQQQGLKRFQSWCRPSRNSSRG